MIAELAGEVLADERVGVEAALAVPGEELAVFERGDRELPIVLLDPDQRIRQARDCGIAAQGSQATAVRRAVEESEQPEHGELPSALFFFPTQPFFVGRDRPECVTALDPRIRLFELHAIAPPDVAAVRLGEESALDVERQSMAFDVFDQLIEILLASPDTELLEQVNPRLGAQPLQRPLRRRASVERREILHALPRGHDAQPWILGREPSEQRG